MTAISTKGLGIYLEKAGTTRKDLVPTAVEKAADPKITVADVAGLAVGDVVIVQFTGFTEIDGNTYYIGTIDAAGKTFTLAGANTTASNGTLSVSPKVTVVNRVSTVKLCLSQFDIGNPSTNTTDVGTFCGDASLPGAVTPGSITMGGFASPDDEGLAELIKADADGQSRAILLILPGTPELKNGAFTGEVAVSGLGYSLPLNGAVGYTVTATQARKFAYRFPKA